MILQFLKSSFHSVTAALRKTRERLGSRLRSLFGRGPIDEELFSACEELLYEADFGVTFSTELAEKIRHFLRKNPEAKADGVLALLENELLATCADFDFELKKSSEVKVPTVILVVGTNGNGKTTFIAKLASRLKTDGHKVLLAAADTFRAAAQEQIDIWAKKLGIDLIRGTYTADPAAVVFDAIEAAKNRGADFVLVDTAGRLENKTHLMKELEKIKRSCQKLAPEAPHETLLVIDATIGQNGLEIAKTFKEFVPLSGLVLTKIDGSAKGGGAIAIQRELHLPIKFLGTGEGISDLVPFEPKSFIHALFFEE
jgi:fused signal recognition particle receptor